MGRVPGRVGDLEGAVEQPLPALEHPEVPLRHRHRAAPHSRSISEPYSRPALASSFAGSIRCAAPRACTYTSSSGQRSTSEPARPGVVEVDVGEQQRPRAALAERLEQRLQARCRPGVDQHPVDLEARRSRARGRDAFRSIRLTGGCPLVPRPPAPSGRPAASRSSPWSRRHPRAGRTRPAIELVLPLPLSQAFRPRPSLTRSSAASSEGASFGGRGSRRSPRGAAGKRSIAESASPVSCRARSRASSTIRRPLLPDPVGLGIELGESLSRRPHGDRGRPPCGRSRAAPRPRSGTGW